MTNAHATWNKMQERKQKLIIRKTYAETQEQKNSVKLFFSY